MKDLIITDKKTQYMLITVVCAASFMMTLDYSSLNIALGSISNYFNVKGGLIGWLPMAELLVVTSAVLCFGKLGDTIGHKKVFLIGLYIYIAGAIACLFAPSFYFLLGAKTFQSFGQAMFSGMTIAFLTIFLPANIKGRALGIYATLQGLGLTLGPIVGGFVVEKFNWRGAVFLVIPISIATVLLGSKFIPSKENLSQEKSFDYVGATLFFFGMLTFIFTLNQGIMLGWLSPTILISTITAVVCLAGFFFREKIISCPILDLNLFKNINFSLSIIATILVLALYIGISFLLPFYLQLVRHLSTTNIGAILMLPALMMMILAPITGSLSDHIHPRNLCLIGITIVMIAFVLLAFITENTPMINIAITVCALGIGMGFFLAPGSKLVMTQAPIDKQGVSAGVYKVALNSGSSIGISLFMLVASQVILHDLTKTNVLLSQIREHTDILMSGFHGVFVFGVAISLVALVCLVFIKTGKNTQKCASAS